MNKAFEGLGIERSNIYITNILKCRAFSNTSLENEEINSCLNYLRNQVILVKPKIIVLLGNIVLKNILGKEYNFESVRGNFIERKGILYMATWSLNDLLRDESKKLDFWNDLKQVVSKIKTY